MPTKSITSRSKNYDEAVKITSKGQVTIPQHIRERYGFMPETEVEFRERDGVVVLEAAHRRSRDAADRFVETVRGTARTSLSADEIMRLTRDYDSE